MMNDNKQRGNEFYKQQDYLNASKCYKQCLKQEPTKDVAAAAHNNLAQCYLFLKDYVKVIEHATIVLDFDCNCVKALFRRAQAYNAIENYKCCLEDLQRVLRLEPKNMSAQNLIKTVDQRVEVLRTSQESLSGKISSMFRLITDNTNQETALSNLIALLNEEPRAAPEAIWNHPDFKIIYQLLHSDHETESIIGLAQALLGRICLKNPKWGYAILVTLTPKYFFSNIYSNRGVQALSFVSHMLESLTQIKSYQEERESHAKINQRQVTQRPFRAYSFTAGMKEPVEEILTNLTKGINSCRLLGPVRDSLLELLIQFVPEETGICWSRKLVQIENATDRMLDVASAVAHSALGITNRTERELCSTTTNTRMILACLMQKIWSDLIANDKLRQKMADRCSEYILDLLADPFIESKVEAASVIGTLFQGPFELGSQMMAREGILEGLLLLCQSSVLSHQTVALDTIILATNKKDQCLGVVTQATPVLKTLYKSPNEAVKIRALVGLCKLGVAGGSDASIRALGEGSTLTLAKSCKTLLLNSMKKEENMLWCLEGFAFLSLDAEVKHFLAQDASLLATLFKLTSFDGMLQLGFPLVSILHHMMGQSTERNEEMTPEMVELANYAKQHIPEQHELDLPGPLEQRRRWLLDAGLPTALYNCTFNLASGPVASNQLGLRELISRVFFYSSEIADKRGALVSAGAGKALLELALKGGNTPKGKLFAEHCLARLAINMDPRLAFPGQRSLETIRPILQLLQMDCSGLQNFEALLALTNLTSLDDVHRHRVMAEKGVPGIDHYLFEEQPQLRRAACECYSNMAQYEPFVINCGGTLPLEEHVVGKDLILHGSSTERIKLLTLYCGQMDDLGLVSAAAGALATMSYDPGIILQITRVDSWLGIVQGLACCEVPAIQFRGAYLVKNMVTYGDKNLAEFLSKSTMFEVLMALSRLADLDPERDSLPPAAVVIAQGQMPIKEIARHASSDRANTKKFAQQALEKLQDMGLIMAVDPK